MTTTTRNNPLDIKKNEDGMLFIQRDGSLQGAIRYDDETFQVTGVAVAEEGKRKYWNLTGTGDVTDSVTGRLFLDEGGTGSTGNAKPAVTGKVTTENSKVERRLAGWLRTGPKSEFYSMKLTVPGTGGGASA